MKADAFRAYLEAPRGGALSALSARSYVSRLLRIERLLKIDLDHIDLSKDGLGALGQALRPFKDKEYNAKSFGDALTAVRRYAAFANGQAPV